jgi:hypothetical protein
MTKRRDLAALAKASVRAPRPERREDVPRHHGAGKRAPGYVRFTVSVYAAEAAWVDETVRQLQRAGVPRASRSFVVREALLGLQNLGTDALMKNFTS